MNINWTQAVEYEIFTLCCYLSVVYKIYRKKYANMLSYSTCVISI